MAEWTPQMQAELDASIGGAQRADAPAPAGTFVPGQEGGEGEPGGEPAEPRTMEELLETVKGMRRRLGERDHEIGELRKTVGSLQGKAEAPNTPDPEALQAEEDKRFERVMSVSDPNWRQNKEDSAYVDAMKTQYRMQRLFMSAVNDMIGEIRGEREQEMMEARLQSAGLTAEVKAQIAADPGLSGLWEAADFNGRARLIQLVGAGGAGRPSAVGGARQTPRRIDASLAIERPGISGVPLGVQASPELDRDTVAGMMADPANKKRLEYMLDEMLDQQNQTAPGYKMNPTVRGR